MCTGFHLGCVCRSFGFCRGSTHYVVVLGRTNLVPGGGGGGGGGKSSRGHSLSPLPVRLVMGVCQK